MSKAQYDSIGTAYDVVAGLDIYHRVFWGVSTRRYRAFADAARAACGEGVLLDLGCGSMLFTAGVHRAHERSAVGVDASLGMLRRARARVGSSGGPHTLALLQADALHSPFFSNSFDAVICMHLAHVLDDLRGLLDETRRILNPGGKLFLTSVVLVDSWRDRYLRMLFRRGIMASPRRREAVVTAVGTSFGTAPVSDVTGSMLFVQATKPQ